MPKFMTYQRPAPVNKSNWNGKPSGAPPQQVRLPAKLKSQAPKPEPPIGKPSGRTSGH